LDWRQFRQCRLFESQPLPVFKLVYYTFGLPLGFVVFAVSLMIKALDFLQLLCYNILLLHLIRGCPTMPDDHSTITFSLDEVREADMKRILLTVYDALKEKGYNPISQIVGYLLSEDPTYITTHNNARSLIRRIDRDELLKAMVRSYLGE